MELLDTSSSNLAVRAGALIDGVCDTLRRDVLITITSGKINRITPYRPELVPEGYRYLDLSDLTVLPPLVDCHVHLALDGYDFNAALRRWDDPDALRRQAARQLQTTLECGIAAVRDGGDRRGIAFAFSRRMALEKQPALRILAPIHALRKPGKYGSFLGPDLTEHPEEAVDGLAAAGANLIKVLVSGVVSFVEYGRVGPLQFTPDELAAIVRRAHGYGLKVMAHASSDRAVAMAVEAGVNSVEHGYFVTRDTLELMAERGVAWVPTVIPVACRVKKPFCDTHTADEIAVIDRTYKEHLEKIALADELGVMLGTGTDAGAAGVPHGEGLHEELALWVQAGLKPAAILRAATKAGAAILGLEGELGTVAEGRPANFIAVPGDPLKDITCLRRPAYFISTFKPDTLCSHPKKQWL